MIKGEGWEDLEAQGGQSMPILTIEDRDASHRIALEQAIAYVTQLRLVAQDAPHGCVLDACEKLALSDGRALLRSTLAAALESRIVEREKRGIVPPGLRTSVRRCSGSPAAKPL
jgi:hypothetical protein